MKFFRFSIAAAALTASLAGVAHAEAPASAPLDFSIDPQPMEQALKEFARQSGYQVFFQSELPKGRNAPAVVGRIAPEAALEQLLSNSGLSYRLVNARTVAIRGAEDATGKRTANTPEFYASLLRLAQGEGAPSPVLDGSGERGMETSTKSSSSREPAMLEEIVVTARRKEEKAQSVPMAITAIGQEQLTQEHINSMQDLMHFVPSLNATGFARNNMQLTLRGQGQSPGTGIPGVVTYLSEVPIPADTYGQSVAGPGTYYDLENVQVLKGPQGTLFGRNTAGGAILFQHKMPTNELSGHLQLGSGNDDMRNVDAVLNVPIMPDKLLVRFAVNSEKREGYTKSLGSPGFPNGRDLDGYDYLAGRATVTFKLTDALRNDLTFHYSDFDSNGQSMIFSDYNPNTWLAGAFPPSLLQPVFEQQQALGIRTQVPTGVASDHDHDRFTLLADVLSYEFTENLTFRNVFGQLELKRTGGADRDGTVFPILDAYAYPTHKKQYTEEMQLQGKSLGGALDWVVGLFYLNSPAQEFGSLKARYFGGTLSDGQARNRSTSKAGYVHGTYDLSSWISGLRVTAGLRYTSDTTFAQTRDVTACGTDDCINTTPITTRRGESKATTWNWGLDYDLTPNALLYFAMRRGWRPGGFNGNAQINIASLKRPFGPELITDQEIGIKADWRLGSVQGQTNLAVYHQAYTDIQVFQLIAVEDDGTGQPGIASLIQNAADARTNGAELEASIWPTRSLRLGAIGSWTDFKYKNFKPGVENIDAVLAGEHFSRPKYQYGVNARYVLPLSLSAGEVSLSANWSWTDKHGYSVEYYGPGADWPAYGLLSLGANWNQIGGKPLDASFFMTNALDKTYVVNRIQLYNPVGFASTSYGEPRMYGLRLRYNFGSN